MAFVFFDGTGTHTPTTSPRITLRRGGLFALNAAAVKMLGTDVEHVQVGYDTEKGAVGIRKAPEDALGKYVLRRPPKGSTRLINGKRFLEHNKLGEYTSRKAQTFNVEDFGDGLIGLYLNGKGEEEPKTKPRPKKAA